MTDLEFPIFVLDFEASGLGEFTYPIEIGISCWSPGATIETWSSLIDPPVQWRQHRIWDRKSETIHGLKLDDLGHGLEPGAALIQANEIVGDHIAYCDGGEHDVRWLRHLAQAAGQEPSFRLGHWNDLLACLRPNERTAVFTALKLQPAPHRAGLDAERLLLALMNALSLGRSNA